MMGNTAAALRPANVMPTSNVKVTPAKQHTARRIAVAKANAATRKK